ncbi:MAG: hypothetical protein IPL40_08630 [Proteobacteria bacterium]|nr:hypothetical protein [Pseudomonadota bacterium]
MAIRWARLVELDQPLRVMLLALRQALLVMALLLREPRAERGESRSLLGGLGGQRAALGLERHQLGLQWPEQRITLARRRRETGREARIFDGQRRGALAKLVELDAGLIALAAQPLALALAGAKALGQHGRLALRLDLPGLAPAGQRLGDAPQQQRINRQRARQRSASHACKFDHRRQPRPRAAPGRSAARRPRETNASRALPPPRRAPLRLSSAHLSSGNRRGRFAATTIAHHTSPAAELEPRFCAARFCAGGGSCLSSPG